MHGQNHIKFIFIPLDLCRFGIGYRKWHENRRRHCGRYSLCSWRCSEKALPNSKR